MKRYILAIFGIVMAISFASGIIANPANTDSSPVNARRSKVTLEQARKNALKKIEGKVEEEFSIEDEKGNTTAYIFIIKKKDNKKFEVEVDAEDGKVISAEEVDDEEGEEDPQILRVNG